MATLAQCVGIAPLENEIARHGRRINMAGLAGGLAPVWVGPVLRKRRISPRQKCRDQRRA